MGLQAQNLSINVFIFKSVLCCSQSCASWKTDTMILFISLNKPVHATFSSLSNETSWSCKNWFNFKNLECLTEMYPWNRLVHIKNTMYYCSILCHMTLCDINIKWFYIVFRSKEKKALKYRFSINKIVKEYLRSNVETDEQVSRYFECFKHMWSFEIFEDILVQLNER